MADIGLTMQTPDDAAALFSYIFPIGYSNSSDCGYCRSSRSGQSRTQKKRYSYYASASSLTPAFYQKLVDRCWRRSGTLLYRPNQKNSCCPHYTIRLDTTQFKPNKDQRHAINRFNRYITGEAYVKEAARLYPRSREEVRKRDNEFDLVERIHEAETEILKSPPEPAHKFTVTLEPDSFTEEKFDVFENYQRIVHHEEQGDKISRHGFKRFLCNSPLTRGTVPNPDGTKRQIGSFHQCYRIDGKLVAIGVLDLLPDCVSAVYFIYHESIHMLNPGKLGALREIALAMEGGYRWWYSGYYIHNCPKMRYKIDYSPQYVLDPETLQWDYLDKDALAIFDKKSYVSLSRERAGLGGGGEKQQVGDEKEKGKEEMANGHPLDVTNDTNLPTKLENGVSGTSPNGSGEAEEAGADDGGDDGEDEAFLLQSGMPGIPSVADMEAVDMDGLLLRSDYTDDFFVASDLQVWEKEDISQYGTLRSRIAELVAAIGPDLMGEVCIDFRKRKG